jgi:hypothetical protein
VAGPEIGDISWDRMSRGVQKVRERLYRAAAVLDAAGISYAVIGGNAVAAWVSRVDESWVRNTRDVDFLIRREDHDRIKEVLAALGFVCQHAKSIAMFLDGPEAKARDAVHVIHAGERVRPDDLIPTPDITESEIGRVEDGPTFRVLSLEPLVRMKLTSYRDKDRTHLRDLIDVGLIDATWPARFPPELAARLQHILDTPDG